tara:strand:- start:554 stop:1174 length:621 start_codon:yes stop_codon:yes gene_type:complete
MKLQIEILEKNNEMFIKDIKQINIGLHQIFNINKKSIGSVGEKDDNMPTKISDTSSGKIIEGNGSVTEIKNDLKDIVQDKQEINQHNDFLNINSTKINDKKDDIIDENNDIIDNILEGNDLEDEIDDEIDDDSDDEDEIVDLENDIKLDDNDIITDDIVLGGNHSDELQKYLDMSVKDLKEKCVELDLKHSGNKHTLAQRIVDKLG